MFSSCFFFHIPHLLFEKFKVHGWMKEQTFQHFFSPNSTFQLIKFYIKKKISFSFYASLLLLFYVTDAPPVLLYSFIEQTLQPGPAVSLKCSATGNPTPEVTWKLDGFPLPSNGR